MRLDLFVNLKCQRSIKTAYYSLVLNILCAIYFVMFDPQSSDIRYIR